MADQSPSRRDGRADSGMESETSGSGRKIGRRVGLIMAAVVVALGVTYGVLYAMWGDSLARGAVVEGVDVGGMTSDEAEEALESELSGQVDEPIHVTADDGETTFEVVPSQAGLTVDIAATVDEVAGGSANPVSLINAIVGTGETTPVTNVDREALKTAVDEIAAQADADPVNGAVAFEEGEVSASAPQNGRAVDVEATMDSLEAAYFGSESEGLPIGDVPLVADEIEPKVTGDEVDRAVAEFAEPAMSEPVTVAADGATTTIEPDVISEALAMSPDDSGTLAPSLDGEALSEAAHDELTEVGQEGKDALITIQDGGPTITPAEVGQGIKPGELGDKVLPALTEEGDARRAEVQLTEVEPELTTEAAENLGVSEVIAEFTTQFPHADYRNVNIGTAADSIDNVLIEPGDEFSLNDIVGERTEANGFTAGTIINEGRLEDSLGGGVSQVATTAFHAAYTAGLEDVEHWPHSIYFDRYPIGQEATVAWGAKDMRFGNDTPYGVVVDTSFSPSSEGSQGSITVRIWSTKHFDVETSVSDKYDATSPNTIYDTSDECTAQSGSEGFSITSFRKVTGPDGEVVKDEEDPWTYNPNHQVVCGPEPDN